MIRRVPRATIDFETRSAAKLRKVGPWRYSIDPSTEVLCLAYRLSHWKKGRTALWHPAFPDLGIPARMEYDSLLELFEWIANGGLVEAHNAWFERCVWRNQMIPRFDFPPVQHEQWRDSAAKAAAHALPRGLEDAIAALGLKVTKDVEGSKLMKRLTKPRKARKAEVEEYGDELPILYFQSPKEFKRLCAYCRQDVLAEECLSEALPDLNDHETQVWLMDQAMNERGFGLDPQAIDTALHLINLETVRLNNELKTLTKGRITKATQRANMLIWFESEGLELPDTKRETLDWASQRSDLTPAAKRGLEIIQALGRSSTAKYTAMKNWIDPADNRARGGLLYHGASTGRWSGSGIQPHNFPRGGVKDMEHAWEILNSRDPKVILAHYPDVMQTVSHALRGAIVPAPGRQLYVADYAAIEARVLMWLADEEDAMALFRSGADIYCEMASSIYGYPCNKKDNPNERSLGKVAILGLGYQMGWSKFMDTCWSMAKIRIDDTLSQKTVNAYRERFWRVKQLWYDIEEAACEAVHSKSPVVCGKVEWIKEGRFLYCELPSGRRLAYPDPEVRPRETPWGDIKYALTFKAIDQYTRQWRRQTTYGGMLVENIDQAVSRDLMAEAMLRCAASNIYDPVLSVHDELIAEADLGKGDVKEFEDLMAALPDWAEGCPVAAEGWRGLRYRK